MIKLNCYCFSWLIIKANLLDTNCIKYIFLHSHWQKKNATKSSPSTNTSTTRHHIKSRVGRSILDKLCASTAFIILPIGFSCRPEHTHMAENNRKTKKKQLRQNHLLGIYWQKLNFKWAERVHKFVLAARRLELIPFCETCYAKYRKIIVCVTHCVRHITNNDLITEKRQGFGYL